MSTLHRRLADLFSLYVRATDGVERNRLGAQLDALAPEILAERWAPIPGGPYEVSTRGRVRRMTNRCGEHIFQPALKRGYCAVVFTLGNRPGTYLVHRLVLEAFVGPCPPGHEAAHGNGHRDDNRLENLRWATKLENAEDKRRHGTMYGGERHHLARFTEADVLAILERVARGEQQKAIAASYGCNPTVINHIACGRTWKHLTTKGEVHVPEGDEAEGKVAVGSHGCDGRGQDVLRSAPGAKAR